MPKSFHLYLDETGTRKLNKNRESTEKYEAFGIGGFLIREEDIEIAKQAHDDLCSKWNINYPLHLTKIRNGNSPFGWLRRIEGDVERLRTIEAFNTDLGDCLKKFPMIGLGCVVNKQKFYTEASEQYPKSRWAICKTAFTITLERAARFAIDENRKLRVYIEASGEKDDRRLIQYFNEMKIGGNPFNKENSSKYSPLSQYELADVLYDIQVHKKSEGKLIHFADILAYPIMRGAYPDKPYWLHSFLMNSGILSDAILPTEAIPVRGIKYAHFKSSANFPLVPNAD